MNLRALVPSEFPFITACMFILTLPYSFPVILAMRNGSDITLPFGPTAFASVSVIAYVPSLVSNLGLAIFLDLTIGKEAYYQLMGFLFVLSIPVSLWAMRAAHESKPPSFEFADSQKLRHLFQSPWCRVLFLTHNRMTFFICTPTIWVGFLCSLSSTLFHMILLELMIDRLFSVEDGTVAPRNPLLVAGVSLEFLCTALLEMNMKHAGRLLGGYTNPDAEQALCISEDSLSSNDAKPLGTGADPCSADVIELESRWAA